MQAKTLVLLLAVPGLAHAGNTLDPTPMDFVCTDCSTTTYIATPTSATLGGDCNDDVTLEATLAFPAWSLGTDTLVVGDMSCQAKDGSTTASLDLNMLLMSPGGAVIAQVQGNSTGSAGTTQTLGLWTGPLLPHTAETSPGYTVQGTLENTDGSCDTTLEFLGCTVTYTTTQSLTMGSGWQILSTYIDPADPDAANVFSDISNNFLMVKNGQGDVYLPDYGFNGIGDLVVGQAYQAYMYSPDSLAVTGTRVDVDTPIEVLPGWNMLGYLRTTPMSPWSAFASLEAELGSLDDVFAKDDQGAFFWPAFGFNGMGNMQAGEGYQVYNGTPDTLSLVYPTE
jgi:hypothetical protein